MKKIVFLVVIAIGATTSVPALRSRAAATLGPTLGPYLDRVLNPIRVNLAERREEMLLQRLRDVRRGGTENPKPEEFPAWVKTWVADPNAYLDPWHRAYQLLVREDSVFVVSMGPDGKRGTEDDIKAGIPVPGAY